MPPRAKAAARAGADESEDDLLATGTISSSIQSKRHAAAKMAKPKTTTCRTSAGKTAAKRKAAPKQSRQALKDRTNIPDGNETEEVDAFEDEDMLEKPKAKLAKTATTRQTTRGNKQTDDAITENVPALKRGRAARRVPSQEPLLTIPETQPDTDMMEDVEQSIEIDPETLEVSKPLSPEPVRNLRQPVRAASVQPLQPRQSARAGSAQSGYQRARERSGSVSATDRRGGDPETRRQLNELTTKYENLTLKYESLQELGKTGADTNFEKLKRAGDRKAKDANELIASLKKELAELRKSTSTASSETASLQRQVAALTASNEKVTVERDELKEKLQVSQNEVKSLETKLSAARQQTSSVQESKIQESNVKKLNSSVSAHSSESQKEAKMRENLYADLTGLVVLGVKRNEGEDIFDCIQTGRNGTLHFHLSVGNDASTPHPKTPSGLSYEDAEFAYEPLLDENRDKELLDLLPDYLTEEICFPRAHAQRFYSKVVDSMTKKIIVDDDE